MGGRTGSRGSTPTSNRWRMASAFLPSSGRSAAASGLAPRLAMISWMPSSMTGCSAATPTRKRYWIPADRCAPPGRSRSAGARSSPSGPRRCESELRREPFLELGLDGLKGGVGRPGTAAPAGAAAPAFARAPFAVGGAGADAFPGAGLLGAFWAGLTAGLSAGLLFAAGAFGFALFLAFFSFLFFALWLFLPDIAALLDV